jgi:hypothetical protein
MRLLICLFSPATGTLGGLTRGLAIAEAATLAGHGVAFCASGVVERDLRRRGHRVYTVPAPTMLGLPAAMSHRIERRTQRASLPIRQAGPSAASGRCFSYRAMRGPAS